MATERVSVQDPISIKQNSVESVAFDLLEKIASYEGKEDERKKRDYWLKLYYQCLRATKGFDLAQILTGE